jgi:DNA polymerase/3'-5' exonuclease PolX
MLLEQAKQIARELVAQMSPHCVRCEIGGSIRRRKAEVKDIEIVAVANWDWEKYDLFAEMKVNLLFRWAVNTSGIRWIKPGTSEVIDWQPQPTGKYWRGLLPAGIKLDLFITSLETYGLIYLIRTGSADFSAALMTYAKNETPYRVEGGWLMKGAEQVCTPDEERVFELLGLEYVEPHLRLDGRAIRKRRD